LERLNWRMVVLVVIAILIVLILSLYEITRASWEPVIERKIIRTEFVEMPKVKRIVDTKIVTNNEPTEFLVTGYTAGPESTGKNPGHPLYGVTATGTKVKEPTASEPGTCAVDPSVVELGTVLYVEGYGLCVAEDIGGAIKGYHIDVYLETVEQVYKQIGKGKRNVWILEDWGLKSEGD
jgi:3D (Asp-Asp-Asp) domain-containing protein